MEFKYREQGGMLRFESGLHFPLGRRWSCWLAGEHFVSCISTRREVHKTKLAGKVENVVTPQAELTRNKLIDRETTTPNSAMYHGSSVLSEGPCCGWFSYGWYSVRILIATVAATPFHASLSSRLNSNSYSYGLLSSQTSVVWCKRSVGIKQRFLCMLHTQTRGVIWK